MIDRIASPRIAAHRIAAPRIAAHCIASHRSATHRIASHRSAAHRIASHRRVLPHIIYHCPMPYITAHCRISFPYIASHHRALPHIGSLRIASLRIILLSFAYTRASYLQASLRITAHCTTHHYASLSIGSRTTYCISVHRMISPRITAHCPISDRHITLPRSLTISFATLYSAMHHCRIGGHLTIFRMDI
jgi:hypothetical protein